jgi:molybdopterin molybdotransferase
MPDGALIPEATAGGCDDARGLLSPSEVRKRLLAAVRPVTDAETVPLHAALGRIVAEPPVATLDLPPFDQSAMDGYGLGRCSLRPGAMPRVTRLVTAGAVPGAALDADEAVRVLTGSALPAGVAAVVMQEHAVASAGRVRALRAPCAGDNIRRRGEDVARGERLVEAGTCLDARHLALLAAASVAEVQALRRLRVAVVSNGNELGTAVRDSNRPMLLALLAAPWIACTDLGVVPDDAGAIARTLASAAPTHDLILASGGVSGSEADHVPGAISQAGGVVERLKLALKPGKPLAHGRIGEAVCLCLPGNPLAALVAMLVFGRPLLARMAGTQPDEPRPSAAISGEGFDRKAGREEYLPVRVMGHDAFGVPIVERSGQGGSGRLKPLSQADGLLWLAADRASVSTGDAVHFHPFATAFGL